MMVKMKMKNSEKLMKHCRMRIINNHVIYSAVIHVLIVLAIHSLKVKQMLEFFCCSVVEQLSVELISK